METFGQFNTDEIRKNNFSLQDLVNGPFTLQKLKMKVPKKTRSLDSEYVPVTVSKHSMFFNEKDCFLMIFQREPEELVKHDREDVETQDKQVEPHAHSDNLEDTKLFYKAAMSILNTIFSFIDKLHL